jgi:hypothetical protein
VDPRGDEQHRADRHQHRRADGELERPSGAQHLEHQQGRSQVGHAGRYPGQQIEGCAAGGRGGQGDRQQLHRQRGQCCEPDKPLERTEMSFRLETLEGSHGPVV